MKAPFFITRKRSINLMIKHLCFWKIGLLGVRRRLWGCQI